LLDGANLEGSNLIGADLLGASLKGSDLLASDLRQAQLILKEGDQVFTVELAGAKVNSDTSWPSEFAPPNTTIFVDQ
ncbi:MAG: pentapeptide repeat-containing protein, partial [Caldilineaceae bacterium]|nr:pentapeptide repeat-containing protein [Caldilineaceae bacterium]